MIIYISGPMTGYEALNFPAFNAAEALLASLGHQVVNPAKLNPDPSTPWHRCMRIDIKALMDCDAIAMLPGYKFSKGAMGELFNAKLVCMAVFELVEGALVPVSVPAAALKVAKPKKSRSAPPDWEPSGEFCRWALLELNLKPAEIHRRLAMFKDHEFKNVPTDWNKAAKNWLRRDAIAVVNKKAPVLQAVSFRERDNQARAAQHRALTGGILGGSRSPPDFIDEVPHATARIAQSLD